MVLLESLRELGLKYECMEHYSGGPPCCFDCGSHDLRQLALDHTNGGGQAERNRYSHGRGSGVYYGSLRRRGYPDTLGLQVVCDACHRKRHKEEGRYRRRHLVPVGFSDRIDWASLEQAGLWDEE